MAVSNMAVKISKEIVAALKMTYVETKLKKTHCARSEAVKMAT